MKVTFESKGGFENTLNWLNRMTKTSPKMSLNEIATAGEVNLAMNTPVDTGETASGWTSEIKTNGSTTEISWLNKAHPDAQVNVAKLLDLGHGTGTGGYVPPRPYIKRSMESIWKTAGDKIYKELND